MTSQHSSEHLVYPDDCDVFGHVNASAFMRVFERARWDAISRGPGLGVFTETRIWPAVRRVAVEYYLTAKAGDRLALDTVLTHHGETSFTLHQTARRASDGAVVAEADVLIVCLGADGETVRVPEGIRRFFGHRPSVPSGQTQHFVVRGLATAVDIQGEGPAVLFVHGFPFDRTMWRHLVSTLTGWKRVAPDLRGMGLSDVPENAYSMDEYADDLAALLDALRIDKAVVCGLSMGGYIAFELFRRHRDRVRALVLANTKARADAAAEKTSRDDLIALAEREGVEALADRLIPRLISPSSLSAMPRVVDHIRTMIAGTPLRGTTGALAALRDRPDSTSRLSQIDVPALVIAGADDQLIPTRVARAMAAAIPGAQFTLIPEAGHLTPLEQPIAMSRVIAEFLEFVR